MMFFESILLAVRRPPVQTYLSSDKAAHVTFACFDFAGLVEMMPRNPAYL